MRLKLIVLITFIVVSLVWWFPAFKDTQPEVVADSESIYPEFTAKNLHQKVYDENGQLNQQIFAKELEHYNELSLTHFKQPDFVIYQDNKPYWKFSAQEGNLQDGLLILDNNVTMLQLSEPKSAIEIKTEYLEIDLNASMVTTDNTIRIESDKVLIRGEGLNADLNQGSIALIKHVQTIIKRS